MDRYQDVTSEWTLDYPPLFAWMEYLLACLANWVEPRMLVLSESPYISFKTLLFQRLSVVILDLVLVSAALYAFRKLPCGQSIVHFLLVVSNAGLLVVDHIHFQYNGVLLGLLMWSILAIGEGHNLVGGFLFAALVNMKHLFIFAGPVFFTYLLRSYCWGSQFPANFARLGSIVLCVFATSFGPFIWSGQIYQVLQRLFPFDRGLLHAYWAPNAWALYAFLDKILTGMKQGLGFTTPTEYAANFTGGLVKSSKFGILPQVLPSTSLFMVVVAMLPCLAFIWNRPQPTILMESVAYANLCAFVWGYHVHEKAILTVLVPLAFATVQPQVLTSLHQDFYHFSTIAIYSLLPLIFTSQEYPIKLCLLFAHILIVQIIRPVCRKTDGGMRTAWGHLPKIHTLGLILIEAYSVLLHERMLKHRFPFLPLMVTSVYCSIGIFGYWVKWSILFLKNISNAGGNFSKLIQK